MSCALITRIANNYIGLAVESQSGEQAAVSEGPTRTGSQAFGCSGWTRRSGGRGLVREMSIQRPDTL
eukprot:scaffold255549_cov26-Prasinocladus_malaysianus.AAC.1